MNMVASRIDARKSVPGGRPLGLFAINLDRSPDRWAAIEAGFGSLAWPLHRVAGVDARNDPQAVLSVRGTALADDGQGLGWNLHRNRRFMLTEEACLAGHVMAWRQFLASDFQHALVLEDDAAPQPGFEQTLSSLLAKGFDADIVKLEGIYRAGGRRSLALAELGGHRLVRSLRPCSGSAAYLVTRPAAEQLLTRIGRLLVPADDFLWAPSLHGLRLADVSPWIVMQSDAVSVIATDRGEKQARVAASPFRGPAMALRRAMERLALLWAACDGRPHILVKATMAPWAPDDYNRGNKTAVCADDRRSSNG